MLEKYRFMGLIKRGLGLSYNFKDFSEKIAGIHISYAGLAIGESWGDRSYRLIAGDSMPDELRRSMRSEVDGVNRRGVDVPSGRLGFIEFEVLGQTEFYIVHIGVEPEHRHRGVGTALVQAVENVARRKGAVSCYALVYRSQLHAGEMFRKLGYQEVEEVDEFTKVVKTLGK